MINDEQESWISYPGERTIAKAFRLRPHEPRGAVLVIHEVWGFTPYIQEVCGRLYAMGYAAIAPLLYSNEGALSDSDLIREALNVVWDLSLGDRYEKPKLQAKMDEKNASERIRRLLTRLYDREFRNRLLQDLISVCESTPSEEGNLGVIGFSMGGGLALRLAPRSRRLRGCVVFSAEPPKTESIAAITCPILAFYGCEDSFMTRGVPRFVGDIIDHRKELTLKTYPSAGHEFFDHTNSGYEPQAASDSWEMSAAFLRRKLEGIQG